VGLTKTAGEAAVEAFIREGWLEKSRAGFITLSERGLLELKEYVLEMFNDMDEESEGNGRTDKIRTCLVCQEIVTKVFPSVTGLWLILGTTMCDVTMSSAIS